jgi:hypothetical protein
MQGLLSHPLKNGRRRLTAPAQSLRLINHHKHDKLRVLSRYIACERSQHPPTAIAAANRVNFLSRAGFTRHRIAINGRRLARTECNRIG